MYKTKTGYRWQPVRHIFLNPVWWYQTGVGNDDHFPKPRRAYVFLTLGTLLRKEPSLWKICVAVFGSHPLGSTTWQCTQLIGVPSPSYEQGCSSGSTVTPNMVCCLSACTTSCTDPPGTIPTKKFELRRGSVMSSSRFCVSCLHYPPKNALRQQVVHSFSIVFPQL